MISKTMKQLFHLALLWALSSNLAFSQVPVDEIDWTTQSGTSGSTINGVLWSATGTDQDGTGNFGVVGDKFVFEDTEGSQVCPCGTGDTDPCGSNDNVILIDPIPIINYCQTTVSFDISIQGNVKCGDLDDQDPADVAVASCLSDTDPKWGGTDALEVTIMTIETGEIRTIRICGSSSSTGSLSVSETFDVGQLGTALMITIIGGTQQGGSYEIGKITVEGLPRQNTSINLELGGKPANNQVCVGQGFFEINTGIADANSQYIWAYPDGTTESGTLASGHDVLVVDNIAPANSGTYRVTVIDQNLCELTDQISVTVLSSDNPNCQSRAQFGSIEAIECSFDTLPLTDDNGITGIWSPGHILSDHVGQALNFTFLPDDPSVASETLFITVEDETLLNSFGSQPPLAPIFCNDTDETHDFLEIFQLQYDQYRLEVQGDIYLFDFIPPGSNAFVEDFATQFRNISVKGVPPQENLRFSITGYSNCGAEPITKEFFINIVGPFDPIEIDTTLCVGDYIDWGGYKFFQDTTIFGDDACDTMVSVKIHPIQPVTTVRTEGISAGCGEGIYYYGRVIDGAFRGFVKAPLAGPPPFGPDFDTVFTESVLGTYALPFPASNGCDSLQRISFSIGNSSVTRMAFDLCSNQDTTIMVGSSYIRVDAREPYWHIPTGGCSFLEIDANILPAMADTLPSDTLCASEIRTVEVAPGDFRDFDNTLTYPYTVDLEVGSNGCPATFTVDFTFIEPTRGTEFVRLCPGEIYNLGGTTFTQATIDQEVTLVGVASTGCDSIVSVTVEMITPDNITINETICQEDNYIVEGVVFDIDNDAGIVRVPSSKGCDSIVYDVTLDFYAVSDIIIDPKICPGDVINLPEYNAVIDDQNLTQDLTTINDDGCIQNVLIRASMDDPIMEEFDVFICPGEVYNFGGIDRTVSGDYLGTFGASNGCDSVVTVHLTVRDEIPTTDDGVITECAGLPVVYLGTSYPNAGQYFDTLTSVNGCDSVVAFEVAFDPIPKENIGVMKTCPDGGTVTVLGKTYDQEGIYEDTLVAVSGCDSIITFEVDYYDIPNVDIGTLTTCSFVPLEFLGNTYDTEGRYAETLQGANGCDSIVTFTVSFNPIPTMDLGIINTCPDEAVNMFGNEYSDEGIYEATIQDDSGCDSTISFEVKFYEIPVTDLGTFTSCPEIPVEVLGQTYNQAGDFNEVLRGSNGCDSIVSFSVVYEAKEIPVVEASVCPGEQYFVFNNAYAIGTDEFITEPGASTDGCDSTVHLILTILENPTSNEEHTICAGETVTVGSTDFTASVADAEVRFPRPGRCDSIVMVTVNVLPEIEEDLGIISVCKDEPLAVGDTSVTGPGIHRLTFEASTGCDSIVQVEISEYPEYVENMSTTMCTGETMDFNGKSYDQEGLYRDTMQTTEGCDSIIIIDVQFFAEIDTIFLPTETICNGGSFTFNGEDYQTEGDHFINLQSTNGCDSIVVLSLEFKSEVANTIQAETCANQPYSFEGQTFTSTGMYPIFYPRPNQCDSTVMLDLIVHDIYDEDLGTVELCPGTFLDVGGFILDQEETYTVPLVSQFGCDSMVTVTIVFTDDIEVDLGTVTICQGDTYTFGNLQITESGLYTDTSLSSLGCDSITTIMVDMTPLLSINTEDLIGSCEGGANGSFLIQGIPGAAPPFSIFGIPGHDQIELLPYRISGLSEGTYDFEIEDANGCISEGQVVITNDRDNALTIESVVIDPAGQFELSLDYEGEIVSISWEDVEGLSCYDCPNPKVNIEETTTFTVTIIDADGCESTASITLEVDEIGNIYFPNVINPNSSLGNHRFFPQTEVGNNARYDLSVFDRWGNLVYQKLNAVVNDPSSGWNGRYEDNRINAGVFVYSVRMFKDNGITKMFKGDITVVE